MFAYRFLISPNNTLVGTKALFQGEWIERQYPGKQQFASIDDACKDIEATFIRLKCTTAGLLIQKDAHSENTIIACVVLK